MTRDPNSYRAALIHIQELFEEAMQVSCTCGTPEGEMTCPHCGKMEEIRRFADVAGHLKASDRDDIGEWVFDGQEGWIYQPPAP